MATGSLPIERKATARQAAGTRAAASARKSAGADRAGPALDESALTPILGYSLAQAGIAMRPAFEARIGTPLRLRTVEFTVLQLLLSNGDVAQTRLARTLAMSAPNLTTLLDQLEDRKLVVRRRNAKDRRAQLVCLTAAGDLLARRTRQLARTMEEERLGALSAAERAMLIELLQRVAAQRSR
jgi:DNA-binding MarR family transcriptional regulator